MILILQKSRKKINVFITVFIVILCGVILYTQNKTPIVSAANLNHFNPGNIMSDSVMSNKYTMSVRDIQTFLDSKNPCNNTNVHLAKNYPQLKYTIRNGKFICMAQDIFDGETAAQIIWKASQDYSINPGVLIVLLEKEQGLITDTWPNHIQYRSATGFGCPDTAACNSQYYGLKNQIRNAAKMFRDVLDGGWTNYPVGPNYVRFHPNTACGGTIVDIKNRATSALYRYTPYQPNRAALSAGYGVGDNCSAYGNRNFYALFTDWFGNTDDGVFINPTKVSQDILRIKNQYVDILGSESSNILIEYGEVPRAWQNFQNGTVIWTKQYGAKAIPAGDIHNRWRQLGGSLGQLGVPTSNQVTESDGRVWQNFSKGVIIYGKNTGAWEIVPGPIGDVWRQLGGSIGSLGKPTSPVTVSLNGQRQQNFEKGVVIRRNLYSQAFSIYDNELYKAWNGSQSILGVPTSNQVTESDGRVWQNFQNGTVIWTKQYGAKAIPAGDIHNRWRQLGGSLGQLGVPTSNQVTESDGRVWQNFSKGVIIYGKNTGAWEILFDSVIYSVWQQAGGSLGKYGKPISTQTTTSNKTSQRFENGSIFL